MEEPSMSYSIFYTDEPTPARKMPDTCRVIPVDSDSMGAAIKAACGLVSDGVVVWKIRGPDGFIMERSDIEIECLRRRGGQVKTHS
jgi:hypothetical protein